MRIDDNVGCVERICVKGLPFYHPGVADYKERENNGKCYVQNQQVLATADVQQNT